MKPVRHPRNRQRGSALIEISLSYATLVIVALLSLKASVNATSGQTWTVKQSMSDAYITRETALASRIPYDVLTGASSPWSNYPSVSTSTVTIGKLPGGQLVTATLHRTRIPDANNLSSAGGTGTATSNPSGTEAWKVQSILAYTVGDRQYVKSRTVLRIR
ncbi:MAG: hypothetical protein KDN18_20745 [Verrucomicrobiae bacterium]|nr:hypothetical protein [Verrucomicrobiae bacterium]